MLPLNNVSFGILRLVHLKKNGAEKEHKLS